VIHADAPKPDKTEGRSPWRGVAVLRRAGKDRVDLIGWLGQDDELYQDTASLYAWLAEQDGRYGRPVFLGAAVMLPDPMTFEFPHKWQHPG